MHRTKKTSDCSYCLHQFYLRDSKRRPAKCTLCDGKPCLACERQLELHRQIEATKKLLDELIVQEHEARMDINSFHNPIHRLPPEITAHIFRFTVADFVSQKTDRGRGSRFQSELGALTLGAICRVWRTIAWTTPRLWCNVVLSICSAPTSNKIAVVGQWLERSKPLPLTISLDIDYLYDDLDEDDADMFGDLFDKFNEHSARWETLSLDLPNWATMLFIGDQSSAAPLKTLRLLLQDPEEIPHPTFSLRGVPEPKPNHVIITGYRELKYIGISWNNLTDATVKFLLLRDCIQLLHLAPMLVNIRLQSIVLEETLPVKTLLVHDHLRTLELTPEFKSISLQDYPTFYSAILDNFTLPLLEDLSIESSCHEFLPLPFDSLKNLLGRSFCPLITLRMDGFECEQQAVLDLLYVLPPSLKNIQLDVQETFSDDHDLSLLFDHLSRNPVVTQHETSASELLPNLETFNYRVFYSEETIIPWDRFPNLLRPLSGQPRPFKELTIIERDCRIKPPPPMYTKGVKFEKCVIRDLVTLIEDGVDLFLPCKVSPQDLLALLEE